MSVDHLIPGHNVPFSEQVAEDEKWMQLALQQAQLAAGKDEVPVGAVIVEAGEVIAEAHNQPIGAHDATAHAEIMALRQASQFKANYRLPETTLYVTIEPCTMCLGALIHARIKRLVIGAREPRAGAAVSRQKLLDSDCFNHQIQWVEGVLAEECAVLIQDFFRNKRA